MARTLPSEVNVSRETLDRLAIFEEMLIKWNRKINLVSPQTIPELWDRHIVDSLQIIQHRPANSAVWADLGSGGGLPGLVVAIARLEWSEDADVHLLESDQRKAAFLRSVSARLGLSCTIHAKRIEEVQGLAANVISARALAPLTDLLAAAKQHIRTDGVMLFHKGRTAFQEIEMAKDSWVFDVVDHTSILDSSSTILEIRNVMARHD